MAIIVPKPCLHEKTRPAPAAAAAAAAPAKLTRAQRNRLSAIKSRQRKLAEQERLKQHCMDLEKTVELLKAENARLKAVATTGSTSFVNGNATDAAPALLSDADIALLGRIEAATAPPTYKTTPSPTPPPLGALTTESPLSLASDESGTGDGQTLSAPSPMTPFGGDPRDANVTMSASPDRSGACIGTNDNFKPAVLDVRSCKPSGVAAEPQQKGHCSCSPGSSPPRRSPSSTMPAIRQDSSTWVATTASSQSVRTPAPRLPSTQQQQQQERVVSPSTASMAFLTALLIPSIANGLTHPRPQHPQIQDVNRTPKPTPQVAHRALKALASASTRHRRLSIKYLGLLTRSRSSRRQASA